MSRRNFRGRVASPRPAAAWLMSIVASATLWITEQLPLWIVAVQLIAFGLSFATRDRPPAFRRSPLWLNVGMLGITTVTIRSALAGNPATVSLAYFSSLAQSLQLMDARPRRSEFLLVALALFQVILASNLTDSVFFPPLLVVFLGSVTWTLLVHTLRMEAAEAGDADAASTVLTPDLRRLAMVSTASCVLLALILFIALPRFRTQVISGRVGSGLALSGFSDRVTLGTVGRIRNDESIVMRVSGPDGALPAPADAYWRGLAFDAFDGRDWSISRAERQAGRRAISGVGRFGIELRKESGAALRSQQIIREPVEAGVVFTPGEVHRIEGPFQRLESDRNGGLYLPGLGNERIRYTLWWTPPEHEETMLREDRAAAPLERRPGGARPTDRYLKLPELDPRVAAKAARIVEGAASDLDRARAIEASLRREGRYTDSPPPLGDETRSPIEAFVLGDLEGHCEYFASAMVVLARSQGLPTRLVNGFAGGVKNEVGGFLEVARADAHAWVEIHFEKAGWVRFDPTPPGLRMRAEIPRSLWARLEQVGSAIELWWFQRVVDFDSADQIGALRGLWQRWHASRSRSHSDEPADSPSAPGRPGGERSDGWLVAPGLILLALLLALALHRRWRASRREHEIPESYRRARRLLARRGWIRSPSTSARDFAAALHEELPAPAARAFDEITECYLAERFGATGPLDAGEALDVLEDAIDRMGLRDQPHVS
jgi:hypothetical protein